MSIKLLSVFDEAKKFEELVLILVLNADACVDDWDL